MLSIGHFSKIVNLTTKTLRYYDEIGLLKPAHVDSDSGYRFYDVSQLENVLLIGRLKAYGFALEEIAQVLRGERAGPGLLPLMKEKQQRMESMIANQTDVLNRMRGDIANLERGTNIMSYLNAITVTLTETPPRQILSIRECTDARRTGEYIHRLYADIAGRKLTPLAPPMVIFHGEEFNMEHYDLEFAVPVQESVQGTRELPAFLCATATLRGNYSGLTSVYAKIREWMEQEGYVSAAPGYEVYVTDPAETPPDEAVTEVYFPVKKA